MRTTLPHSKTPGSATGNQAYPWIPDQGDGTYRNPIIHADYSDPDVIRVGGDYYLVASSFNCTPGLPILHSRDLVNWTIINHAVGNLPHPRYAMLQPGCGVWAPSLRRYAGKFWIFFAMPDEGIYVITADHPAKKWSKPRLVQEGRGLIDPCPLWDDDGRAYLVHAYAHSRSGLKHQLRVRPMSPDGSKLLGDGEIVFHRPERHPTIEGPKFLKRGGWYYILAPAGGVEAGWQVALRSKNIFGPYEDRMVLEQGGSSVNGPHQGALTDTPRGEWWFVHFQDTGIYGRITHLQPVRWQNDWPLIGRQNKNRAGEPVSHHGKPRSTKSGRPVVPQTSDEFDSGKPGLQWQWQANHQKDWCKPGARKGWLRLTAQRAGRERPALLPHLLLQKFPARSFTAETLVEFAPRQTGEESGLIVTGESYAALALRRKGRGNQIELEIDGVQKFVQSGAPNLLKLRVAVEDGGLCRFSFAADDEWVPISQTFRARKGVWIGAKLGVYCLGRRRGAAAGHADFDYFRFR